MDNEKKFYSLIGMAAKGGFVKSGEFMAEQSVKDFKAKLVLVATDASDNTKKHFGDMCRYRKIPIYEYGSKEVLGHSIGKGERATITIENEGFAKSLMSKLNSEAADTASGNFQEDDN